MGPGLIARVIAAGRSGTTAHHRTPVHSRTLLGDVRAGARRTTAPAPIAEPRPVVTATARWLFTAIVALLVAPFVISAIRMVFAIGGSYLPWADHAVIELNVRDVGHHAVLVGLYSRFGWFHPGPLIFYVLAVPYRILGSRSIGMQVGALAVNAAAIVGCLAVARRRGGAPLLLCTAACIALFMRAASPDFLRDPWTPYVAVLPLAFTVLLAWNVADGTVWALPWVVGVATFVVQTHIGFAPVALALVLWAVVVSCVRTWRSRRRPDRSAPLLRPVLVSLATGVVLWAAPVYAELFTSDHNMGKIWHYFTNAGPGAGWGTAWRVMSVQLGLRPEWVFAARTPSLSGSAAQANGIAIPWLLVLGAGALAVAVVLGHRALGTLVATLVVATASGVYAVSAVTGPLFPYLVRWSWVIGLGWGVAVLWAVWLLCSHVLVPRVSSATLARVAAPAALVTVAVLAVVVSVSTVRSPGPQAEQQPLIRSISSQTLANLPAGNGPVIFVGTNGGMDEIALALQLERHGVPVLFSDFNGDVVRNRRAHQVRYRALITVISGPEAVHAAAPPGQLVVARSTERYTPADIAKARSLVRATVRRFGPGSRAARDAQRRLDAALTKPKAALVVFAHSPAPA